VPTTTSLRIGEQLGFYTGLGVVIVFLAGTAIGRLSAVPSRAVPVATTTETEPTEPVVTS
jgi:hypothetical protein